MSRIMIKKRIWMVLLAVTVALGVTSCGASKKQKMNLLFITLDTTRADHLGCYGYTNAPTPVLDALAANGVVFEKAISCVPLTLPSHTTMFTGLLPPEHGLRTNGENSLDPSVPTMAEAFKKEGYATAAIIASMVLDKRFGLARGFDYYNDSIVSPELDEEGLRAYRPGVEVIDTAINWLEEAGDTPFFCWVHLFDPHKPYHAHEDLYGDRYVDMPYDAEIVYMDSQIGRLIDWLKAHNLMDNTMVVALGDHGEGLGDHGELYHGIMLYDTTLHVPLLMHRPGLLPQGKRIAERMSLVNIYPTILSLFGISANATPFAKDLSQAALGKATFLPEDCYAETEEPWWQYGWSPLKALYSDRWKYIETPDEELYDTQTDFDEEKNLDVQYPNQIAAMSDQLSEMEQRMKAQSVVGVNLSTEDARVLQSLGYGGGGAPPPEDLETANLPDVKKMVPLLNRVMYAKSLMAQKKIPEALKLIEESIAPDPNNVSFMFVYAEALHLAGRLQEAMDVLHRILDQGGYKVTRVTTLDSCTLMAKCLYNMGRIPEAITYMEAALEIDNESVVALNGWAWIVATNPKATPDELAKAQKYAEQAVALTDRKHPSYLDTLAVVYAANGNFAEAVKVQQAVLKVATEKNDLDLLREARQRLALFQQNRPFQPWQRR
ncbi:MAG: tetratricopeptide repeat protein [Spartobacteria bacterium]|nr:tetratricopeptide repeat protein [Spartobacteria bacterium]